ncbi:heat shock 70 kDa protein 12A-like [Mytilus galloprovincialis]|uniref:heat shock 70 kDa protein 12A-like n=1 Tax=Mytilus galloprovincialis TaxID=29158 RepID=UPI003F7C30C4
MAQIPSKRCGFCNDNLSALYCDGCEQFLCLICKRNIHDKVPRFKDHKVLDINKVSNSVFKPKPVCISHKKEFLLYCSTCDCLACKECMTSSHNGHTTDSIENIVDVYRDDAKQIQEKLKAKVEILQSTLETIETNQTLQIKSDFDSHVQKVEGTSREMYGIVDHIKTINMTAASDFQTIEKQDLERKRVFFQRHYDDSSSTLLQFETLIQEPYAVTFFTEWKRLKKDVNNMCDIDQKLEDPKQIESFNEEYFMRAVIEEIDNRLTKRMLNEKKSKIDELQMEVDDSKRKQAKLENLSHKQENYIKELQQKLRNGTCGEEQLQYKNERPIVALIEDKDALKQKQTHLPPIRIPSMRNALVCAALDIGTTHSGYAYSTRNEYEKEQTNIHTNIWKGSSLCSFKAPTAVLLDSGQKLVAFGYEAENMYSELVADEEHEDYYYFRKLMMLPEKGINRNTEIMDELNKPMAALDVLHLTIRFLKDHILKAIRINYRCIEDRDIHYAFTVPAIWDDSAYAFMKEAAYMAGIRREQLSLIPDPEAVFIYCQHLKYKNDQFAIPQTIRPGMQYMVVDLGGSTANITVHQRYGDGSLKEVVPASGGPWSGKSLDEAFLRFLKRICGPKVMKELRKTELEDFIDLVREFESKKRSIRVDQTSRVVVTLPVSLIDLMKRHKKITKIGLDQSPYGQAVSYSNQKLHISPDTFRDLFQSTTEALINHLERMFRDDKLSDLDNLIMVGGFSECELIQHRMKEKFGKHKKIIIPEEAGLAVLKGAVLFGHQPIAITRVLRRTYGIRSWPEWDLQMHSESKRVHLDGVNRCKDIFFKYFQVGEMVQCSQQESQVFQAVRPFETTLECAIYVSSDPNPLYVTDPSCQRLGNLIVDLPRMKNTDASKILVEITMVIGDTELLVRAKNFVTGRVFETQLDMC